MHAGAEPGDSLHASNIRYKGLVESIQVIEEAGAGGGGGGESGAASGEAQPQGFDAWICFSQGAVLAHHILQLGLTAVHGLPVTESGAALMHTDEVGASATAAAADPLPDPHSIAHRCAAILPASMVLVCGFPSRAKSDWPADRPIDFPTLIIKSPTDTTVSIDLQEELEGRFAPLHRSTLSHTHGHAMVQRAADVELLLDWLHKNRAVT
jgi:hypothetical protein